MSPPRNFWLQSQKNCLGEEAGVSPELLEDLDHRGIKKGLQDADSDILGGTVDDKEGKPKVQFADGVVVYNVQVDLF